jgi:hypothetical protein
MKEYKVKVIVTEIHYITVEAKNIAEAEGKGESYGFHAQDAISTEVEVESVQLIENK